MCVFLFIFMCVYLYIYVYTCIYIYVYVCVRISLCMACLCIWTCVQHVCVCPCRPLLFQTSELISSSAVVGELIPYSTLLSFLFSRAPGELRSPHQVHVHTHTVYIYTHKCTHTYLHKPHAFIYQNHFGAHGCVCGYRDNAASRWCVSESGGTSRSCSVQNALI